MFNSTIKNHLYKAVINYMTGTTRKPSSWHDQLDLKYKAMFIGKRVDVLREEMEHAECVRDMEIKKLVSTTECTCHFTDTEVDDYMTHSFDCEKYKTGATANNHSALTYKLQLTPHDYHNLQRMVSLVDNLQHYTIQGIDSF
jgi:hypothetical protein